MDILLLEHMAPDTVSWLETHYSVAFRPELALDLVALRKEAYKTQAIVFPRHTRVTRELLDFLPKLKAIGRLVGGMDNTDLDFCKDRGIKVIYAGSSHVRSNAEYLLSSLLHLYRRALASAASGGRPGVMPPARELHGSTVGILGLSPVAHILAGMLASLGVRLIGYDPAVHHTSPIWEQLRIQPVALPELMNRSDAVSVQMLDLARFKGFINDKLLVNCRRHQLWVGISLRALFDEGALAAALWSEKSVSYAGPGLANPRGEPAILLACCAPHRRCVGGATHRHRPPNGYARAAPRGRLRLIGLD